MPKFNVRINAVLYAETTLEIDADNEEHAASCVSQIFRGEELNGILHKNKNATILNDPSVWDLVKTKKLEVTEVKRRYPHGLTIKEKLARHG